MARKTPEKKQSDESPEKGGEKAGAKKGGAETELQKFLKKARDLEKKIKEFNPADNDPLEQAHLANLNRAKTTLEEIQTAPAKSKAAQNRANEIINAYGVINAAEAALNDANVRLTNPTNVKEYASTYPGFSRGYTFDIPAGSPSPCFSFKNEYSPGLYQWGNTYFNPGDIHIDNPIIGSLARTRQGNRDVFTIWTRDSFRGTLTVDTAGGHRLVLNPTTPVAKAEAASASVKKAQPEMQKEVKKSTKKTKNMREKQVEVPEKGSAIDQAKVAVKKAEAFLDGNASEEGIREAARIMKLHLKGIAALDKKAKGKDEAVHEMMRRIETVIGSLDEKADATKKANSPEAKREAQENTISDAKALLLNSNDSVAMRAKAAEIKKFKTPEPKDGSLLSLKATKENGELTDLVKKLEDKAKQLEDKAKQIKDDAVKREKEEEEKNKTPLDRFVEKANQLLDENGPVEAMLKAGGGSTDKLDGLIKTLSDLEKDIQTENKDNNLSANFAGTNIRRKIAELQALRMKGPDSVIKSANALADSGAQLVNKYNNTPDNKLIEDMRILAPKLDAMIASNPEANTLRPTEWADAVSNMQSVANILRDKVNISDLSQDADKATGSIDKMLSDVKKATKPAAALQALDPSVIGSLERIMSNFDEVTSSSKTRADTTKFNKVKAATDKLNRYGNVLRALARFEETNGMKPERNKSDARENILNVLNTSFAKLQATEKADVLAMPASTVLLDGNQVVKYDESAKVFYIVGTSAVPESRLNAINPLSKITKGFEKWTNIASDAAITPEIKALLPKNTVSIRNLRGSTYVKTTGGEVLVMRDLKWMGAAESRGIQNPKEAAKYNEIVTLVHESMPRWFGLKSGVPGFLYELDMEGNMWAKYVKTGQLKKYVETADKWDDIQGEFKYGSQEFDNPKEFAKNKGKELLNALPKDGTWQFTSAEIMKTLNLRNEALVRFFDGDCYLLDNGKQQILKNEQWVDVAENANISNKNAARLYSAILQKTGQYGDWVKIFSTIPDEKGYDYRIGPDRMMQRRKAGIVQTYDTSGMIVVNWA